MQKNRFIQKIIGENVFIERKPQSDTNKVCFENRFICPIERFLLEIQSMNHKHKNDIIIIGTSFAYVENALESSSKQLCADIVRSICW